MHERDRRRAAHRRRRGPTNRTGGAGLVSSDELRIEHGEHYFVEAYNGMDVLVALAANEDDWAWITVDHAGPETRFGWTTPYKDEESPSGIGLAFFVPRIVEQCARLDDNAFNHYLTIVEYQLNHHISHYDECDVDAWRSIVDRALYDNGPGALALMNAVQLAALDRSPT